LKCSQ